MKIKSRYKDYYDHISHKYGADPDCAYARIPLKEVYIEWVPSRRGHAYSTDFADTIQRWGGKHNRDVINQDLELSFVIAGPHVATYLRSRKNYDQLVLVDRERHAHYFQKDYDTKKPGFPKVPQGERLNALIRLVGAPVFMVRRREGDKLLLDDRIPVLGDLGFANLVPAQQMWQDIYATLSNVLRTNPDKDPPVQVAEKYRIQEKGFDLKTSFRHPIDLKKLR